MSAKYDYNIFLLYFFFMDRDSDFPDQDQDFCRSGQRSRIRNTAIRLASGMAAQLNIYNFNVFKQKKVPNIIIINTSICLICLTYLDLIMM